MPVRADELLAVVERSGLVEEYHEGTVAVVDSHGRLVAFAGDVDRPFYYRSASKPFQATVSMEAGADLPPTHLAVACASHSGDPVHVAIVLDILARAGLSESDLRCPPARPMPAADRRLVLTGDIEPVRRYHNCSGKHAAMLAACVASGWDTATYLEPHHPLQRRVADLLTDVSDIESRAPGVDGCGAPVWRTTTAGLARAFAHLETDERFEPVRRVMAAYPLLVSGVGRNDGAIGQWLGAAAKVGAAGCLGVAVAGHGIAAKAWSGSSEVAGVGVGLGLTHLGLLTASLADALRDVVQPPVFGGAEETGRIRPVAVLESV